MSNSRTSNSMKNIIFSITYQVISLVLSFVNRTIFIHVLGAGYLGISGLFSDILNMLSLADLGFTTAMTYSMYEPLVKNDYDTLAGLVNFYKKVYRIIATVVAMLGLAVIPFLKFLVNLENEISHLTLYYLLFLANTVASYLVVYKTCIITADQKNYILTKCNVFWSLAQSIVLMFALPITRSYIVYLVLQVTFVYFSNFHKSYLAQKNYPYIKEKIKLSAEKTNEVFKNIGSVFLYKISSVLINATDNTLISIMVGTESVGYYSNYNIVIGKLSGIVNTIFYSLTASLGNLIVTESYEKRYQIFQVMQSISLIIGNVCIACVFF